MALSSQTKQLSDLLTKIRKCTICEEHLSLGARPVLKASTSAKIAIIGQAPGTKVHKSGIPWDDASGKRLREWMQISNEDFYDENKVAIIPMGFCYPGKGKSGDLPPRKECAPLWHKSLFEMMPNLELTLLIGKYAQDYYLKNAKKNLTENVLHFEEFLPQYLAMPHPSPRNQFWFKKNPWFEKSVLPILREKVKEVI